jgi:hypothetical protein
MYFFEGKPPALMASQEVQKNTSPITTVVLSFFAPCPDEQDGIRH